MSRSKPDRRRVYNYNFWRHVKMKKISYVITVDENNVRIEKRPINPLAQSASETRQRRNFPHGW